jgi:hypothetical protein
VVRNRLTSGFRPTSRCRADIELVLEAARHAPSGKPQPGITSW